MVEQAALIKLISEQVKTQDYRRDFDRMVDFSLTMPQTALLLDMLVKAMRDARYDD